MALTLMKTQKVFSPGGTTACSRYAADISDFAFRIWRFSLGVPPMNTIQTLPRPLLLTILLPMVALAWPCPACAQPRAAAVEGKDFTGRRWALLIGVDQYKRLMKLKYCGNDVRATGQRLVQSGFERDRVVVLHNQAQSLDFQPLKANIEEQVRLILGSARQGDLVLLSFSGHGVRIGGRSYLCPYEADLENPATLVSLDAIFRALEDCPAALKLFVVDACQNDVVPEGERSGVGARAGDEFAKSLSEAPPPQGTLLLTSCAPGEKSREAEEFRHGVFMHYVLEGLGGPADFNGNRVVMLTEMFAYASDRTQDYVRLNYKSLQRPRLRGDIVDFPLVEVGASPEITNTIGMRLRLIPAGQFQMGSRESAAELAKAFEAYGKPSADGFKDEYPMHRVRISKPFYLGVHEVTVGQFGKFVSDSGYQTDAERNEGYEGAFGFNAATGKFEANKGYSWRQVGFPQADDHPVVNVSHNDAVKFCEWLSRKEHVEYRLPTEAEWEYACRAGTTTRYYHGDDPEGLSEVGNVVDATAKSKFSDWSWTISGRDGYVFTAPVGKFTPNDFGLHDVHGNVFEWCADWYDEKYYAASPVDDPTGPTSGSYRVFRGGGWGSSAGRCRAANRYWFVPSPRGSSLGFRLARTVSFPSR